MNVIKKNDLNHNYIISGKELRNIIIDIKEPYNIKHNNSPELSYNSNIQTHNNTHEQTHNNTHEQTHNNTHEQTHNNTTYNKLEDNLWQTCLGCKSDKRLLIFIGNAIISFIILGFSISKLSYENIQPDDKNTYIGLVTLIVGIWVKSPLSA